MASLVPAGLVRYVRDMPPLTILGASARAAAFSVARAGFAPYAIDSFADYDLAALCPAVKIERYPHDFSRALAAAREGPWIYTGGLENHPRLIARLGRLRPLWGNAAAVLTRIRDPWELSAGLTGAGFASPPLARTAASGQWLVKPLKGSAGLGVRRATARDLAQAPRGTVLQQYVPGECGSASYVAAAGRAVFLGATRQLIGRDFDVGPEFLYAGSIGPLPLRADEQDKLRRLGTMLAEQFRLVGLFGVDFVRTSEEIWPVEVNPRYTASLEVLERIAGQHFIALHAAACQERGLPSSPAEFQPSRIAGKAVVYARRDSVVGEAMPWGRESLGAETFALGQNVIPPKTPDPVVVDRPEHADLPPAGQHILAGHPVVTVFAEGASIADVQTQLRLRSQAVLTVLAAAAGGSLSLDPSHPDRFLTEPST